VLGRPRIGNVAPLAALDRPVLVTGTPRSGKTCLACVLDHSPELHLVSEPLAIWNLGTRSRPDDRRSAEEATDRVQREIVRACQRALPQSGKSRYLDDLAYHALRIPFVHRVVPDAKIIHVVRDPEGVIPEMAFYWGRKSTGWSHSLARGRRHLRLGTLPRLAMRFVRNQIHSQRHGRPAAWGPGVPDLTDFAAGHGPAETAAYQWQQMVEIALDDLASLPGGAWLEVRFERLIDDPGGELERVAAFCELEDSRPVTERARDHLDAAWPNPYIAELSASEWAAVRKRVAPLRHRLGYA
jgi:hypothetical protein